MFPRRTRKQPDVARVPLNSRRKSQKTQKQLHTRTHLCSKSSQRTRMFQELKCFHVDLYPRHIPRIRRRCRTLPLSTLLMLGHFLLWAPAAYMQGIRLEERLSSTPTERKCLPSLHSLYFSLSLAVFLLISLSRTLSLSLLVSKDMRSGGANGGLSQKPFSLNT